MAETVFANMQALTDDDLVKYAGELGLDVEKFKADFASQEIKDEVAKDAQAGRGAGVRGTPTIFVNGKRYQGQRTLDGFKPLIDEEIGAAEALIKAGTPPEKVYETRAKVNAAPPAQ